MDTKITHVAVAVNNCHSVSYARILYEDGTRGESWGTGVEVLGEILSRTGLDKTLVIITHAELVDAASLRAVFPNVTVCAPYDDWTMGLLLSCREAPNRVYEKVRPLEIGTDCSLLKGRIAAWAWVASDDGKTTFRTGTASHTLGTVKVETHAILRALTTCLDGVPRPVLVSTDSKASVDSVLSMLAGEEPWPVWVKPESIHCLSRYTSRDLIRIEWVKGHNFHPLNVVADQLARHAAHCALRKIEKPTVSAEEDMMVRNLMTSQAS